jgi:uncharacterized protein (TIGR00297 family)
MKAALLDTPGLLAALALAAIVIYFAGLQALILVFIFLFAGVLVTRHEHEAKREMGIYEHERSWENVLANGLVPAVCAIISPSVGLGAYIGSLAAITADKFASELGVLSDKPISLANFRPVKQGTSGAMSVFGTVMSFDGALVIGLSCFLLFPGTDLWRVLLIAVIGFMGSFVDTLFGILEEKGIGNKATTNIICSIAGALLGFWLLH